MMHDALPMSVAGDPTNGVSAILPTMVTTSIGSSTVAAIKDMAASHPMTQQEVHPPETTIRLRVLIGKSISEVVANEIKNEIPIDCVAVGHYLRVPPTGAELDIDRAVSQYYRSAAQPGDD